MSTWVIARTRDATSAPRQSDLGGHAAERVDDERDVGVQLDAELGGAAVYVVAIHRARERLVLQLLAYGGRLQAGHDLAGPHESARVDEAGQLVARVERAIQEADARHAGVV